jgi:hypothetical protein
MDARLEETTKISSREALATGSIDEGQPRTFNLDPVSYTLPSPANATSLDDAILVVAEEVSRP